MKGIMIFGTICTLIGLIAGIMIKSSALIHFNSIVMVLWVIAWRLELKT